MTELTIVDFHGQPLWAVQEETGAVLVAVKPICENIGISWPRQYRIILDDQILSEGVAQMAIPSVGGRQETICLPLHLVHGWLFKINAKRVQNKEKRERLIEYQRECYRVLFDHFHGKAEKTLGGDAGSKSANDEDERQWHLFKMAEAIRQGYGSRAFQSFWIAQGLPTTQEMRDVYNRADLFTAAVGRGTAGHA